MCNKYLNYLRSSHRLKIHFQSRLPFESAIRSWIKNLLRILIVRYHDTILLCEIIGPIDVHSKDREAVNAREMSAGRTRTIHTVCQFEMGPE